MHLARLCWRKCDRRSSGEGALNASEVADAEGQATTAMAGSWARPFSFRSNYVESYAGLVTVRIKQDGYSDLIYVSAMG